MVDAASAALINLQESRQVQFLPENLGHEIGSPA
jgi:hypothetical protein